MKSLNFLQEIESVTGESISTCFQCYKCTVGCPVISMMDIYPHSIIRHIILGNRDRVLTSKTIWVCLQCITCSVRCPNNIDIARVFEALRKVSVKEGKEVEKDTWQFDEIFMESVNRYGRLYEGGTIIRYKINRRDLLSDFRMGLGLFLRGRIGVLPHAIKGRRVLKGLLRKRED